MVESPFKRKSARNHVTSPSKKLRTRNTSAANPEDEKQRKVTEPEVETSKPRASRSTDMTTLVGQVLPAGLSFAFEDGKRHLISVDQRFEELFRVSPCKPFEQLETVHPFGALATSIFSQQVSWMAARKITHRFKRLFDPTLPETLDDKIESQSLYFPSPEQVADARVETLKSAGLSMRKAEYVKELAIRFANGSLSSQKLAQATDEELMNMLIELKGIGRWTVDMFSIFSMRRPDILPVGDLGVQRGLLRWALAPYSAVEPTDEGVQQSGNDDMVLPAGLNVRTLKARLAGKKVRGAFLTPREMEELTQNWRPYRSLGVYYMWKL